MTGAAPSVFFATITAGGGHLATANAMAEALHEACPGAFETRVSDVMAEFGFAELDRRHKASWRAMLRRPKLVRAGQRLMDSAPGLTRAAQNLLLDDFAKEAARRLGELSPSLIVANHGWLATALTRAKRRHGLDTRLLVYATEPFDASALWAEPHADRVAAPSAAAKGSLVRLGVPSGKVDVLGYPVRQAFLTAPDRVAARRELGLQEAFTCLLSLGAEGLAGEALPLAAALLDSGAQVVAVAGRNADLERALREMATERPGLMPLGFTDRMPTLLAAADLVVGKAGPASTMEALAVGRPLLITAYAGLNEERVVRFVQSRGLGSYAPRPADVTRQLAQWREPARRQRAQAAAAELDFPGMSQRLARYLAALARGEAADAAARGSGAAEGAFEATDERSLGGPPRPGG